MLKRRAKSAKQGFSDERNKTTLGGGGGGMYELTTLVSSEGKIYKSKWEIMSMLTVDVVTDVT